MSQAAGARAPGILAALLFAAPPAAAAPVPPSLTLERCELEHPLKLTVVPAECAVLEVPEDPQESGGRRIGLKVARVPAINRRRAADALFVLAGGPGQAASDFYATVAGAFERIHRDRDIVLVDQRGTGASNPLACPEDEDQIYRASVAEVSAWTQRCLEAVSGHARPAFYTTSLAVADLERVRAALGYEQLSLYGVSYGTRVAQHYLRRYPQHVRALILDGVVPPALAMGPDVAPNAEAALRRILSRCAQSIDCRARFPDPLADYQGLRRTLAARAVPVSVADPSGGRLRHLDFGPEELASVLRLAGYSADYAALLPLLLHGAAAHADYDALAAQFLLLERSYESIAAGMHNSVVCAEDVPFWGALDRAALAQTFLGTAPVDSLAAICRSWPRGPADADLHAPLASAVPALFLSGGDDPVTPPAYAHRAAAGFSHAREIVLPGFGHGQLSSPCMDRVLAQFLITANAEQLDVSCTAAARPMPFFISVNGPPP